MVEAKESGVPRCSLLAMQTVSATGVAMALERLYTDRDYLRMMSLAAYRNATQSAYRWERIAAQWRWVFDDLLGGHGALPLHAECQWYGRR